MTKENKQFSLSSGKKESVVQLIISEAPNRTNADIKKWRQAIRNAEDEEEPDRTELLDIYADTMLDGLIVSVTQRILFKCTNSQMTFVKDGQADQEHPVSKMIKTPHFLEIIEHIVSAKWYGHSLMELDFEDGQIIDVELVSRKNVIPEKGIVVINIGDVDGILYKEPPTSNYLLEVGKKKDLGLLNPATQYAIFKRSGLSNMAEFIETYGVPIQEYQYDPTVPGSKKETEERARSQGAAAKIVMPIGTKTTIHKGADGNGSMVFKDNKSVNDEDLIFLLQTMTSKDGASKSQAEVHNLGEDELISAYKLFVELVLNYKLKPLLAIHGIDVEGGEFKYADTERLSKATLVKILVELSKIGEVPLEYIEKHLGIKLTRKEVEEEEPEEETQEEETEEEEKKR